MKLSETILTHIQTEARCGAKIHDCIAETILLSVENDVRVTLVHNSVQYLIDGMKIVDAIYTKTNGKNDKTKP